MFYRHSGFRNSNKFLRQTPAIKLKSSVKYGSGLEPVSSDSEQALLFIRFLQVLAWRTGVKTIVIRIFSN